MEMNNTSIIIYYLILILILLYVIQLFCSINYRVRGIVYLPWWYTYYSCTQLLIFWLSNRCLC